MISDIKRHLENVPFAPFQIRMTDGHVYPIPTIDHIWFPPAGGRVVVSDDEGCVIILPALHMSGIVEGTPRKPRTKRSR